MGKKLIIKGADFSANAIDVGTYTWYTNGLENAINNGTRNIYSQGSSVTRFAIDHSFKSGDIVNCVRMGCSTAGTITIARATFAGTDVGSAVTISDARNVNISQVGTDFIVRFTPIVMNDGDYIIIRMNGDTCKFYTYAGLTNAVGYWQVNGQTNKITIVPSQVYELGFDLGKYE